MFLLLMICIRSVYIRSFRPVIITRINIFARERGKIEYKINFFIRLINQDSIILVIRIW